MLALARIIDYIDYISAIAIAIKEVIIVKVVLKSVDGFRRLLIVNGLTQRGLGRAIGIAESYSNQVCSGTRSPSAVVAKKITDHLGVSFDDIFFISDDHSSNQQQINTA